VCFINGSVMLRSTDLVAVSLQENSTPSLNREPNGGASGPDTCKQGFVWREAFDGDTICVTPTERTQTKADSSAAASRRPPDLVVSRAICGVSAALTAARTPRIGSGPKGLGSLRSG
jgi:hypothetical protein